MSPEIERETAQMLCDENMALLAERDALRAEVERLRVVEAAARTALPSAEAMLAMAQQLLFDLSTARACDPITAEMHSATGIPYSALCHHQDRPHCAGCPDDATCEASGREPRGTT